MKILPVLTATALTAVLSAQSFRFDGPSGYVSVPHASALVPQAGITVEAWVNPLSLGSGRPTVVRKNPTAFGETYLLRIEMGRPQFIVQGTSGFHRLWPSTVVPTGVPTHLAATYDGATSNLYMNGVLIGSSTHNSGPLLDTGGELRIGQGDSVSGGEAFLGDIDAVRIWDHPRSGLDIRNGLDRELPFAQGLIASWNCDGTYADATGAHNGSPVGTVANNAAEFRSFGGALDISSASSGFVEVPHNPTLAPTGGLTLEAWVALDPSSSSSGRPTVIRKDPTAFAETYILRIEFGNPQLFIRTASGIHQLRATSVSIPLNTPTHLAGTYDGTTMALYVNGQLAASMPANFGPIVDNGGVLRIGNGDDVSSGERFYGMIDSVRIWSIARSAADIASTRNREIDALPGMVASFGFNGSLNDGSGPGNAAISGGTFAFAPQFGDQLGAEDTGIDTFGAGTSTCATTPLMVSYSLPEIGNTAFSIGSINGVSNGIFFSALGLGRLNAPFPVAGFDLWLDPSAPNATGAGFSNAMGASRTSIPLPASSTLIGSTVYAQDFWLDPCGPLGVSAANALEIRIQN